MTDLTQIYEAVGGLKANADQIRGQVDKMDAKLDSVVSLLAKHGSLPERVEAVEKEVEEFRVVRRAVQLGAAAMVGILGVVGSAITYMLRQ